ncbi:MAG: hypothetical protein MK120_03865 [Puniceicoccaceae bacterium]|nr:hypothetical protein [Puniceicoccaceae bacterium]
MISEYQVRKSYFRRLLCALIATQAVLSAQDISYAGSGNDSNWNNSENWTSGNIPSSSTEGAAFDKDETHVQIDSSTNATCRGFMLGMYGVTNSATISGGSLNCQWLDIGRSNQHGGNGTLTVSDGTVTIAGTLSIPQQFSSNTDTSSIGQGELRLLGGTVTAAYLQIGNRLIGADGGIGSIYITEGELRISGNQTSQLQNYIDLGYITTDSHRSFQLDFDTINNGKTTLITNADFTAVTTSPNPASTSIVCAGSLSALRWSGASGAEAYHVYFGTDTDPPLVATLNGNSRQYTLANVDIEDGQDYYWRVDATQGNTVNTGVVWSFTTDSSVNCVNIAPPFTDYCSMLSQEIQGKKHGFLAGNKTYYIGGFTPSWYISENDTIGFTHPFHNDLRSRGYGMVQDPETGYGHDLTGWEFYKHTKVAYGTVIIDGERYENPAPTAMYWRPDRMICEYQVAGVNIREDKFIALNDTACSIITSDQAVILEFAGQSFYKEGVTQSTTATCNFDVTNNVVHIVEGGVNLVKPTENNQVSGVMMYDGMSTVISASKALQNYTNSTAITGQQFYTFTVPCDANGLSLTWTMHDNGGTAIAEAKAVLTAPQSNLQAKTDYMNGLLNNQIPYFRCSDEDIVQVYYFLWAIYMMYYIDLSDENPNFYPHTQTAVNNFLGMHRYDAAMQIPVSSWIVDKQAYANGNVLRWKTMLEHADLTTGRIPADNLGKTWYSGLMGGVTSHVSGAWQIYQHSGDLNFLSEAYTFYRDLMWNTIPGFWGQQYAAADILGLMSQELGYPQSEAEHWQTVVGSANFENWFNYAWTNHGRSNYFAFGSDQSWTSFGYLLTKNFPNDKARAMVETWAVDGANGYLSDASGHLSTGLLAVKPRNAWNEISENAFFITPDTNTFMLLGMFATNVDDRATEFALEHLKNYNMKWGIPIAPEAINRNYELFGDQYSNFNAGKILVILEGIFGLEYSVVDNSFTVADNLPLAWDYMEAYVPVSDGASTNWTHVRVERIDNGISSTKTVKVHSDSAQTVHIQPWLEGKAIMSAPNTFSNQAAPGHIAYVAQDSTSVSLAVELSEASQSDLLSQSLRLTKLETGVQLNFGLGNEFLANTTVILERSDSLSPANFQEVYRYQTTDGEETKNSEISSSLTPYFFDIIDSQSSKIEAFYRVRTQ